ncbi:MAG TPA: alpha/beta hydrolase [Gammaproteobacteria bacterium]|nr:alpha/beta hydrolase [Gammaproteobacteria bacterium]
MEGRRFGAQSRKVATVAVAAIMAFYSATTFALWALQRELLYHPDSRQTVPPSFYPMLAGVEELRLTTADGVELVAWYAPAPAGRPTVVLFHGNGSTLRGERFRLKYFMDASIGALMVAYRGYSGNPGSPTEEGLYADARAALDWLQARGVRRESIALYGQSLGTGVATKMAAERDFGALILEAPYTSTVDVAAHRFPVIPVRWLMADRFDSLARIDSIEEPLLVMHGDADFVIPQSQARQLYAAANEPKQAFWPSGVGHNDLFDSGGFTTARDFIERQIGPPPTVTPSPAP